MNVTFLSQKNWFVFRKDSHDSKEGKVPLLSFIQKSAKITYLIRYFKGANYKGNNDKF